MQFPGIQFFLQGLIHALLTLHAALPNKFLTYNQGLKMLAIAIKFKQVTGHAGKDKFLDMVGMHHVQPLSFQPRFSRFKVTTDTAAKQVTTTARLISGATSETPKKP